MHSSHPTPPAHSSPPSCAAPDQEDNRPLLQKSQFIEGLALGQEVSDIFMIAAAQQGQARNGPYWRLDLKDASGTISAKLWSPLSQAFSQLSPGSAVWIKARVSSYRDKLELAVDAMRLLAAEEVETLDLSLFMPASPHCFADMHEELTTLAKATLSHKPWRKFILGLLSDDSIQNALRLAPAAKAMHHAYAGGLLEHTLSVARLCLKIAENYPELDKQALFAGAVCHDLGKLWELTPGIAIDYTTEGRLIGHINLLMERLQPFIKKSGLEPHLAEHLQHLILSHHGTYEFGSPRLPATAEAFVLHFADDLDAKLQQVHTALAGVPENAWSGYISPLERFLFQAQKTPEAAEAQGGQKKGAAKSAAKSATKNGEAVQDPLPLFSQASLLSQG